MVDGEIEKGEDVSNGFFACCFVTETKPSQIETDNPVLTFDQPRRIEPEAVFTYPTQRPQTALSMPRSVATLKKRATLTRQRTLSFSARPWTSYSQRKSTFRPLISGPTDFRRVSDPDQFARRGARFRPLELSIYLPDGRLSPLPDFGGFDWGDTPVNLALPKPAVIRESIYEEHEMVAPEPKKQSIDEITLSIEDGPGPILHHDAFGATLPGLGINDLIVPGTVQQDYMISLPTQTLPIRPQTSRNSSRTRSPEPRNGHQRSLSDLVRPLRPMSGSIRRSRPADAVDDAIRELNTIVEEHRATALRQSTASQSATPVPTSPSSHVPAIAPSMRLRARSQTLNDIGSAFSMPLASSSVSTTPRSVTTNFSAPFHPLHSPASPPPPIARATTRTSRLRTFFSWSSTSTESSPLTPDKKLSISQPFYQCAPGAISEAYRPDSPTDTSSLSSSSRSFSESSGSMSPTTAVQTGLTTPMSFSPTKELESDSSFTPRSDLSNSRPRQRSTSSASRQVGSRRYPVRKRDISVDTTMTSSSVATSILGWAGLGHESTIVQELKGGIEEKQGGVTATYREVNPLHQHPVGMAF